MAKILIRAGAEIDVPTREEVREDIHAAVRDVAALENARERELARGIKRIELFIPLPGNSTSAFIGQSSGPTTGNGPEQGYVWSVRLVSIVLAGTGTLTVYKTSTTGDTRRPVFATGTGAPNQVATWSSDQFRIRYGEGIYIVGSTNLTSAFMSAWQVPAEMEWKLL